MKTKLWGLATLFLLGTLGVFGQAKTKSIEVKGNCGMCEKRIENAANAVEGVTEAQWNKKTRVLAFSLDANKANEEQVHKAVTAVGHDKKKMKATDEAYNNLPGCCQYNRTTAPPTEEVKEHEDHEK